MILKRTHILPSCTLGDFQQDDGTHVCYTIELPWLGNHPMTSCIPLGSYSCNTYFSPRHGFNVWRLAGVPDRTEIEIHPANVSAELLGCIGVGDLIGTLDDTMAVLNSQNTFKMLQSTLPDSFNLTIS